MSRPADGDVSNKRRSDICYRSRFASNDSYCLSLLLTLRFCRWTSVYTTTTAPFLENDYTSTWCLHHLRWSYCTNRTIKCRHWHEGHGLTFAISMETKADNNLGIANSNFDLQTSRSCNRKTRSSKIWSNNSVVGALMVFIEVLLTFGLRH